MKNSLLLATLILCGLFSGITAQSAALQLFLPLNRTAYQTNETIDISVIRSDTQALPAGVLTLNVIGEDASKMSFTFPVKAVALTGNDARTTEHLRLNGWLLRPGKYTIQTDCDGATVEKSIQIFTHIRKSTYRTLHWWGPGGDKMGPEGENGFGFNLIYGGVDEPSIRGGMDIMGLDLMGGGHQFDLKMANDWSDPYVYLGATQRGMNRAFSFRTMPNAIGAHLYDEPGLTYAASRNGEFGPWDIAPQRFAYKSAFGVEQMWYDEVKPDDPANMAKWQQVTDFRLGFMDAFWKASYNALKKLKPDYLVATQSQYGWWALFDGYYFNVARSLPVISGHGGYDDYGERNFNPSFYVEISIPRQMDKPTWYLGDWGVYSNEQIREEHYLSFIAGIQGIAGGPSMGVDSKGASAGVESNKIMAKLGTIFAKPAYTRQEVGLFYAKSDLTHATRSKDFLSTRDAIGKLYTATRMIQYPVTGILEEDLLDGSASTHAKVLLMSDIEYLNPTVISALEAYIKAGGHVLMTDDCKVPIQGAEMIGFTYKVPRDHATKPFSFPEVIQNTQPLADALKIKLQRLGIKPAFGTSAPDMAPGRQVLGDIEYLFAVNFTPITRAQTWAKPVAAVASQDWSGDAHLGNPCAVVSTITVPDDGRPVYDALRGGAMAFAKKGNDLSGTFRFGPGQMRVIARTARPIGGVKVATPTITRDYTRDTNPLTLDISATLLSTQNDIIAGTAPLQIKVIDPLGDVRFDIFRATELGTCRLSLPIAANDPAGTWTVIVKELLNNTEGRATFNYQIIPLCGAVAGKSPRAVYYAYDKDNIYNFFRSQRNVTIVAGESAYTTAAANRLATSLKPYNVNCTIISATAANVSRDLTAEEAKTWCGMYASGDLKPGRVNSPSLVGFDLPGPSILLGNPQDNPLIKHLTTAAGNNVSVLPYPINADFPGRGHGYIAWNYTTLGHDLETIACIATDEEGLSEAVGTLFELAIGIDPLTPLVQPIANNVAQATKASAKPAAGIIWQTNMPDNIATLALDGANIVATSWDGSQMTFEKTGKAIATKVDQNVNLSITTAPATRLPQAVVAKLPKDALLKDLAMKQVLDSPTTIAISYWGGMLQLFAADGTLKTQQMLSQDITAMLWNDRTLIIGLAGGDILALGVK